VRRRGEVRGTGVRNPAVCPCLSPTQLIMASPTKLELVPLPSQASTHPRSPPSDTGAAAIPSPPSTSAPATAQRPAPWMRAPQPSRCRRRPALRRPQRPAHWMRAPPPSRQPALWRLAPVATRRPRRSPLVLSVRSYVHLIL
jgi:hypothetical protein